MQFPYKTTICYILNDKNEVLLQKKRRGFGQGKLNGPGGKMDPGETKEECAKREIMEETGIKISQMEEKAYLEFIFPPGQEDSNNQTYVFVASKWEGEPEDKGEGELKWYKSSQLPLDKMWDDDQYWLPQVLAGVNIKMRFYFDEHGRVDKYEYI